MADTERLPYARLDASEQYTVPGSKTLGAPKESDKEVTGAGGCRSHSLDCVWEQPNGPSLNLGWPGVGESSWKRCCLGRLLLDRLMAAGCREGGAEGNFRWKGQHHRKHTLECGETLLKLNYNFQIVKGTALQLAAG